MVRILLSGAVNNAWDELYTRIEKLNALSEKKNNAKFDILICIGKIGLLPEAYTTGKAQIPIKTYCIPAYEGTSTLSTVASHSQNEERELLEAIPNWFLLSEPFGIIEVLQNRSNFHSHSNPYRSKASKSRMWPVCQWKRQNRTKFHFPQKRFVYLTHSQSKCKCSL